MPLIDCSFQETDGKHNPEKLEFLGPGVVVTVCGEEIPTTDDGKKFRNVPALIDTGACQSCIDDDLAKELGLKAVDKITIAGAGGAKEHPMYLAHIIIPQMEIVQWGAFAGVNLKAGGQPHSVLLGRNFLRGCVMIYDGLRAQVTLAAPKSS